MQVAHNLESQRRQYGLADRARQLGWQDVEVIDDDLGRSGGGARRPGFERLPPSARARRRNVCGGLPVGPERTRLAYAAGFCGLVGTVIIDEDGIYDPASPNDRLLLGMKGAMSEMELSVFRQRSIEAMKQKAGRGELFLTVAVGYVKGGRDNIEGSGPAGAEAVALVFRDSRNCRRSGGSWCGSGRKIPLPS
jgi:DNA invertase Pin-like site-specific DNA recombinase